MKLKDCLENYYYYSEKASDITRNLGFAGIAIIWLFKKNIENSLSIPSQLIPSAILIVIALSLDYLQYVVGTLLWGSYHRYKENKGTKQDDDFLASRYINWPALYLFWGKFICISISYVIIICFLMSQVV